MRASVWVALCGLVGVWAQGTALWPMPQSIAYSGDTYTLMPDFFEWNTSANAPNPILDEAVMRYQGIVENAGVTMRRAFFKAFGVAESSSASLTGIDIVLDSSDLTLSLSTNESYTLTVGDNMRVSLAAANVFGAMHGLETFSQLLLTSPNNDGTFQVPGVAISDFPRFQHRGMLLDTSRHFLPVTVLYQQIDALAYNKFNVLHWHIVDDQSFPYVSMEWPLLSEMGAWDQADTYSPEDVQDVIGYALYRGVRVVPEFDSPGHTMSWGNGYPELLTQCYNGDALDGFGPVNPISNFTLPFLKSFFTEVSQVFNDSYVHIGGDEVSFDCWMSNPDIQAWMQEQQYGDNYALLEQYYETNLVAILNAIGRDYIVWEEVFDNGVKVNPNTVVEVWKGGWNETLAAVVQAGLRGILSTPWYLNYISYGEDWPAYYSVEPLDIPATEEQKKLVIGGEACLWGEFIDASNSLSRTWPRASAVGERLWSARDVTNVTDAEIRMNVHRCRLVARNIPAEPCCGPSFCAPEIEVVYTPPWSIDAVARRREN